MLISETDEVILVSDLSLSATRDVVRFIAFCKSVAPHIKVKVLLNKVNGSGLVEVDKKDFEATIEQTVDWEIPLDAKLMIQVARSGKILSQSAKNSKVAKTLFTICDQIVGGIQDTKSVNLWEKIGLSKKNK